PQRNQAAFPETPGSEAIPPTGGTTICEDRPASRSWSRRVRKSVDSAPSRLPARQGAPVTPGSPLVDQVVDRRIRVAKGLADRTFPAGWFAPVPLRRECPSGPDLAMESR